MHLERLNFVGGAGARLSGLLRRPEGPVVGSALLAHCFTCGKDLHTTARLAGALTQAGWLTLTFDFTGLGGSGGDFAATNVATNVADLRRAAVALIQRGSGPCLLIGHSLGGAAAVLAAADLHTVDRVVAIASPAEATHVRRLLRDGRERPDGGVEVSVGGRPFTVGASFRTDLLEHDVEAAAAGLGRPMLVVEAGADTVVGAEQTLRLARAGSADLVTVPGADHLFTGPEHQAALADAVLAWLRGG